MLSFPYYFNNPFRLLLLFVLPQLLFHILKHHPQTPKPENSPLKKTPTNLTNFCYFFKLKNLKNTKNMV